MGTDKALIRLDGEPLVSRALHILRVAGLRASIAGRSSLVSDVPVVEDAGLGPLGGICAGLAAASASMVAFLSVDTPLLPASLVRLMVDHAECTGAMVTTAS